VEQPHDIHRLVLHQGRDGARALAKSGQDRKLVDIAALVQEEESQALGITYSGFCMTALPHRKLADDAVWERSSHRLSMLVEPGRLRINGENRLFGVPYGSRARMILLYLQTRAIQTNCRDVELGRSMNDWLARMNIPVGGKTYDVVREQANRISACHLTFFWNDELAEGFEKDSIVKGGIRLKSPNDRQGTLWEDTVTLSETFFSALKAHPVPIWEPALRHISNQSMTIDIYIWLAYRLQSLARPTAVSWASLYGQFGAGYQEIRKFRLRFKEGLRYACAVYPEARIEIGDDGLLLHPSRPPIERTRLVSLPGLSRSAS
jgi:hypothetical protein